MKSSFVFIFTFLAFFPALICQHNYADALYKTTYYYGSQRCGDTQSWSHAACHLQDGNDVGHDLTGGWHDCGDHIKFGHTGPYTATVLLMGYELAPVAHADNYSPANSAPPANGIPDILDEVKIQTDFLLKTISNDTVFYQVGDSTDHASFHDPAWQSVNLPQSEGGNPRNTYSFTQGGANIAGSAASALALMSINYAAFDSTYAANCLAKAIDYYNIGKNFTGAIPSTTNGGPGNEFYAAGNWADNLALAAIHLYRATGTSSYLTEAEGYYNDANFAVADWYPLTTEYVNQLVHYELYVATSNNLYLTQLTNHMDEMYYHPNNCGYMHFADWGSLYFAEDAAFIACLYHKLTGDTTAYNFAKENVDFALGTHGFISTDAPANHSFVMGYNQLGAGYSEHPHDATAFGKEANAWTLYTQESNSPGSVPYDYLLTGALVGGPKSVCSNYDDNINDYQGNETCIYYNSGLVSALAYINQEENNLLPVEWLEPLRAIPYGDYIELKWVTSSERNNAEYIVQRSTDARDWQDLITIKGNGSTSSASHYRILDTTPITGISYYRLKQVDMDGLFGYSNIVSVKWENSWSEISVLPNPVTEELRVEFYNPRSDKIMFQVFNTYGELMFQRANVIAEHLEIDVSNWDSGIYIVQMLSNDRTVKNKRFIIAQ